MEFHHKNHTEEISIDVTEAAFGEVNEENLLVIHDFANIEARFDLTEGVSHDSVREEWAPFTSKPGDDFAGIAGFLGGWKFFSPVVINGFIGDVFKFRLDEFGVGETLRDINESGTFGVCHQEKRGISEHVLTARAKKALVIGIKERLEHANSLLDDEIFLVFRGKFEHIHADWMFNIGRVEIDNVIDSLFRNAF